MAAVRADALRNRAKVLEVAHALFEEKGSAMTTEDVAKQAGVGIGTVFRHFPTKADLFEALVTDRFDRLADFAESNEGFFPFLERMVEDGPAKRSMIDALAATGFDKRKLVESPAKQRLKKAMTALLEGAQKSGTVRADVDLRDVYAIVAAAGAAVDHHGADKKAAKRALRLVLDGLRKR